MRRVITGCSAVIQGVLYTGVLVMWTLSFWLKEAVITAMLLHLALGCFQLVTAILSRLISKFQSADFKVTIDKYFVLVVLYFLLLWPVSLWTGKMVMLVYVFALPLLPGAVFFKLSLSLWQQQGGIRRSGFLPNLAD